MTFVRTFSVSVAMMITSVASAQTIPPFDENAKTQKVQGKSYLETRFGLSQAQADERYRLMEMAEETSRKLLEALPDQFIGMEIQHEPVFKVILLVSANYRGKETQSLVPPELQRYITVRNSRFDRQSVESTKRAIIAALTGIPFELGYQFAPDKFEVTVPQGSSNRARNALGNDLLPLVQLREGRMTSSFQANAITSDYFAGGWQLYGNGGSAESCTAGFSVRDSSGRQSFVTAQHCVMSNSEKLRNNQNGKEIVFDLPVSSSYYRYGYDSQYGRSYDFRIVPGQIVATGPSIWFWNPKTVQYNYAVHDSSSSSGWTTTSRSYTVNYRGLPGNAYLSLSGTVYNGSTGVYNSGHPVGTVRCKSGDITGFTCGIVTNAAKWFQDKDGKIMDGFVEVGNTTSDIIGYKGDSGGPVVSEPRYNSTYARYEAAAAGIMHGGNHMPINLAFPSVGDRPCVNSIDDEDCRFTFMPIDRINDFGPATVYVFSGASKVHVSP